MNKVLATVLAILAGYVATCWNAGNVLRYDQLFATVPQLLCFIGAAVVTLALIGLSERVQSMRRLNVYTANPDRARAISEYMSRGISAGTFAYNVEPFEYAGHQVLPMNTLYVVHVEGFKALVVPDVPDCEKSYAVFMDTTTMLKYVPPHLIPQMLPG